MSESKWNLFSQPTNVSSSSSAAVANVSITTLLKEAESLFQQAQKYREEMDKLPATETATKQLYEKLILEYLQRARSLSTAVTTSTSVLSSGSK
jgi:hypothetical protein